MIKGSMQIEDFMLINIWMLGHETSLIKFRITEIRSNTFSDHDNLKIEINYKVKSGEKKWSHGD